MMPALVCALWISLAASLYLVLSRDTLRCVIGLGLMGNAVNLLLLASGRLQYTQPAIVPPGESALTLAANPLPQALVLTAIVIGFALLCFSLVVVMAIAERSGKDDLLLLRYTEPKDTAPVAPPFLEEEKETPWQP